MLTKPKNAVHFGAGNIGRGFIGPLLFQSGYHVTFVDVQDIIIDALNRETEYSVYILDQHEAREEISNFSGVMSTDTNTIDAIVNAEIITTSVGPTVLEKVAPIIAQGISERSTRRRTDLTVIACENMIGATSHLKHYVEEALKGREDDLRYIEEHVGFANCEIDRIVPPYKGDSPLEVGVEGFYEWVVEGKAIKGDLQIEGMQLKDNLEPFLERKLFTLNCGHAMLAYLGYIKGYNVITEALEDGDIKHTVHQALFESGAALVRKHGFDETEHKRYIDTTMARYANPNIRDELTRVSRQPLRKLSPNERLVGAVTLCITHDLPRDHLLVGIAAAFHFDVGDDDEAVKLKELVMRKGISAVVEETTAFVSGSFEHRKVLESYEALERWKKGGQH